MDGVQHSRFSMDVRRNQYTSNCLSNTKENKKHIALFAAKVELAKKVGP